MRSDKVHSSRQTDSGEAPPSGISVSRLRRVLDAIETLSGVEVGFLDASGAESRLDPNGLLIASDEGKGRLSQTILQMTVTNPRPVLHRARQGGAAVAMPFLLSGKLGGFINASGFCLVTPDDQQREKVQTLFIAQNQQEIFGTHGGSPVLPFEGFFAMVNLLEAAAAQLTLLSAAAGGLEEKSADEAGLPLSWTVWSLLNDIAATGSDNEELSQALEARERLEAVYNATHYGMLMLDSELKIVAANKVFAEAFDVEADAFMGVSGDWLRKWVKKHAVDPARVSQMIDELLSDPDSVVDDEIELLTPTHMIMRFFSAPLKNKSGEMIGRVFMFRDITEFREARHKMIGTEKASAISRVAAGLAHSLNNILAGVVTYADYALEEDDPKIIKEALSMSVSASERASEVVQKLLVVSGASESLRQDVDLHVELEGLLDSVEEDFKKDNVRIHRLLEPVPRVNVDPVQIQEALKNILNNAREAIGSEGTITVRTQSDWDNGTVRVTISDSGSGIPTQLSERVFDPFFTTRGVVSGGAETGASGLGLSIAKGIVEKHGGKIYVGNVLPHGASFVIEMPLAGTPPQTSLPQEPPASSAY
ncbi:MAG: PAS domain-containing protein [Planctomycetes bacterium]|nr:PAS domain-containing protein [Planctomycetota bacterium]